MALNYQLGKIKNFNDVCYDGNSMKNTAQIIIFLTMSIGINRFTKENIEQVFNRISLMERSGGTQTGAFRMRDREPVYFTLEELKEFIGLETNASPLTSSQFLKRNKIKL